MSILLDILSADVSVSDLRNPAYWVQDALGGRKTVAGELVSPERAMALSVYFACLRNIAEDIGKLPFKVFRRLLPRGKEIMRDHAVYALIHDDASPELSAMTFQELLTHWMLGWGNGYAEIRRAGPAPIALYPIHPTRVTPFRAEKLEGAPVYYRVRSENGVQVDIPAEDMFHLRGLGNVLEGYSVVRLAAESLGLTIAAQTFGAAFFGNGAKIGGVLEHPSRLSEQAQQRLRENWANIYVGPSNAGKTLIAEEGMVYKPIGIPPEEAQFIETRQFQIEEIARWFRMPPHKVGHLLRAVGWSTLEATNTDYVTDTLMPHFVRWEHEVRRKLFRANETDLFAEFVVTGLLRGDQAARSAYYRERFMIGTLSQNDVRELESENPIEGGDTYFVMTNMAAAAGAPPARPPAVSSNRQEGKAVAAVDALKLAQMPVLVDVGERFARKEAKARERATKRYSGQTAEYAEWSDQFYAKHVASMIAAYKPAAYSLARLLAIRAGHIVLPHGAAQAVDGVLLRHLEGLLPWQDSGNEPPVLAAALTDLIAGAVLAELEVCSGRN